MVYNLNQLSVKTADAESVLLIREIKQKSPLPLTEQKLAAMFSRCFVSDEELEVMITALESMEPAMLKIQGLFQSKDADYEPINLQRTINMLKDAPLPLAENIKFAAGIQEGEQEFLKEAVSLLNILPKLKNKEEKIYYNEKLNVLFQRILRNKEFTFYADDLIHELQHEEMKALQESMAKGFFFHVTLEEELKKLQFAQIRQRIDAKKLEYAEGIANELGIIKKGIDKAYEINMRMITFAIILYAYVKYVTSS